MDSAGCGQQTVLVVDDEPDLCEIIRRMLDGQGYSVMTARSFTDAMDQFTGCSESIDLLITDLRLPDGDGQDLATRIRARRPHAAVLYISGLLTAADLVSQDHPASDTDERVTLLSKPFTPAELLAAVTRSLAAR